MWYTCEHSVKPSALDTESSSLYVYVRRNIIEQTIDGNTTWICEQQQIPKADWELYKTVLSQAESISDIENALIEIAELIGG